MKDIFPSVLLTVLSALLATAALAQEPRVTGDQDGSSQQVEESDEAYRRRMELEDARRTNPTYTDPVDSYQRDLEKIDKLPEESRENIRDQLVDVIMENNDWQPGDALKEYPYEPTAAAQADADLMKQEQEAWDEQIEKYHAREAEAFGAYRGPVAGPGNPDGQEGGSEGAEGGQQGQEGGESGGQGQQGGESGQGREGRSGSAGTYQPQNNNAEDEDSTAGVSESALDFLMGRRAGQPQGQPQDQSQDQPQDQSQDQPQDQSQDQPQDQSQDQSQDQPQDQSQDQAQQQERSETSEDSEQQIEPDMRGIIAIDELYKLEGTQPILVNPPEEEQDPDDP